MSAPLLCMMPYSPDKDLGSAYNAAMALLPEDGWACFLDHDAAWTTPVWWRQIQNAIAAEPQAGAFTAITNRIASRWQKDPTAGESNDMALHRRIGQERLSNFNLLDVTDTAGFGGVVLVTSKDAWHAAGGFAPGMFCVDHLYHYALRDAGRRIYLIEGLYVFHMRASSSDRSFIAPTAVNPRTGQPCHCRRHPEPEPTRRRTIP